MPNKVNNPPLINNNLKEFEKVVDYGFQNTSKYKVVKNSQGELSITKKNVFEKIYALFRWLITGVYSSADFSKIQACMQKQLTNLSRILNSTEKREFYSLFQKRVKQINLNSLSSASRDQMSEIISLFNRCLFQKTSLSTKDSVKFNISNGRSFIKGTSQEENSLFQHKGIQVRRTTLKDLGGIYSFEINGEEREEKVDNRMKIFLEKKQIKTVNDLIDKLSDDQTTLSKDQIQKIIDYGCNQQLFGAVLVEISKKIPGLASVDKNNDLQFLKNKDKNNLPELKTENTDKYMFSNNNLLPPYFIHMEKDKQNNNFICYFELPSILTPFTSTEDSTSNEERLITGSWNVSTDKFTIQYQKTSFENYPTLEERGFKIIPKKTEITILS